jgi:hypothetical protein
MQTLSTLPDRYCLTRFRYGFEELGGVSVNATGDLNAESKKYARPRCFVVVEEGRVTGLVTPSEVRAADRAHWPKTPIRKVMRTVDKTSSIARETSIVKAIELMGREGLNQIPLIAGPPCQRNGYAQQHLPGTAIKNRTWSPLTWRDVQHDFHVAISEEKEISPWIRRT